LFTGIIAATGLVRRMTRKQQDASLEIETSLSLNDVKKGDSLSVSGACLTVTSLSGGKFTADVSAETLSKTTLRNLKTGDRVNLEKALQIGDRLGGHLVLGHVDGTGRIIEKTPRSGSLVFGFAIDPAWARYLAVKGSITIDGISLTVNACQKDAFYVNIIPHTAAETTLAIKKVGDEVNIETDIIARYVESLLSGNAENEPNKTENGHGISMETLARYGFIK
jgi:riboflavin synthase